MTQTTSRREFLRCAGGAVALTALGGPFLSACSATTPTPGSKLTAPAISTSKAGAIDMSKIRLAPASGLPDYVQKASLQVQEAYRFALANPEVLTRIPCYCGCNAQGHMNNLDCYVRPNSGGEFEIHGAY